MQEITTLKLESLKCNMRHYFDLIWSVCVYRYSVPRIQEFQYVIIGQCYRSNGISVNQSHNGRFMGARHSKNSMIVRCKVLIGHIEVYNIALLYVATRIPLACLQKKVPT